MGEGAAVAGVGREPALILSESWWSSSSTTTCPVQASANPAVRALFEARLED
ncbi:hypothetical protein [Nostocoides veronense]|uniref:hypothetical protein n=1 Tax=Nostocoides veronense TaxID=330836 RepID=UPI0031DA0865